MDEKDNILFHAIFSVFIWNNVNLYVYYYDSQQVPADCDLCFSMKSMSYAILLINNDYSVAVMFGLLNLYK